MLLPHCWQVANVASQLHKQAVNPSHGDYFVCRRTRSHVEKSSRTQFTAYLRCLSRRWERWKVNLVSQRQKASMLPHFWHYSWRCGLQKRFIIIFKNAYATCSSQPQLETIISPVVHLQQSCYCIRELYEIYRITGENYTRVMQITRV